MDIKLSCQHMSYNFHLTNQSVLNEGINHYKRVEKNDVKGRQESDHGPLLLPWLAWTVGTRSLPLLWLSAVLCTNSKTQIGHKGAQVACPLITESTKNIYTIWIVHFQFMWMMLFNILTFDVIHQVPTNTICYCRMLGISLLVRGTKFQL